MKGEGEAEMEKEEKNEGRKKEGKRGKLWNYFHKSAMQPPPNKTIKKRKYIGLLELVDSTQENRKETSLLSFFGYILLSIATW